MVSSSHAMILLGCMEISIGKLFVKQKCDENAYEHHE